MTLGGNNINQQTNKNMKTNQIMKRPMGQFEVQQRTSDGYFDGNALLSQWKNANKKCKETVTEFINQTKVQAFLSEIEKELGNEAQPEKWGMADLQSVKVIKGCNTKNGRTKDQAWMHPYLFIKFAMWINPKFELQVIKFVYDQLIKTRHLAGDNYNVLTSALATIPYMEYKQVATAIQWIVFNKTGRDLRQSATQKELQEISEIEHSIAFSINMGFIKDFVGLMNVLREMYNKKYRKF